MDLRTKIYEEYKKAIKSKHTDETNTLRLIRSAIKDKDIENRSNDKNSEIDEKQILSLLQNLVKQRKDSIESFKLADRNDLIEKELSEINIINQFLPKQLNEKETYNLIKEYIDKNNLVSLKDMGKIMGFLKTNHAGTIDMGLAGLLSKKLLSS